MNTDIYDTDETGIPYRDFLDNTGLKNLNSNDLQSSDRPTPSVFYGKETGLSNPDLNTLEELPTIDDLNWEDLHDPYENTGLHDPDMEGKKGNSSAIKKSIFNLDDDDPDDQQSPSADSSDAISKKVKKNTEYKNRPPQGNRKKSDTNTTCGNITKNKRDPRIPTIININGYFLGTITNTLLNLSNTDNDSFSIDDDGFLNIWKTEFKDKEIKTKIDEYDNISILADDVEIFKLNNKGQIISVFLPKTTTIKANTFRNSPALKSFSAPKAEVLENNVLSKAPHLKYLYLPEIKTIGNQVLEKTEELEIVSFPKLKVLGDYSFRKAKALKYFGIPNAIYVGKNVVNDAPELTYFNVMNAENNLEGVLKNSQKLSHYFHVNEIDHVNLKQGHAEIFGAEEKTNYYFNNQHQRN